jgi:hypothetical protein
MKKLILLTTLAILAASLAASDVRPPPGRLPDGVGARVAEQ